NIVANHNFVSNESDTNYNDDVGHGTHVAGIVGGDGSGSQGLYKGIAPGASIINARAGNNSGLEEGDIVRAIQWSSKPAPGGAGADIISMSFGGGYPYISDVITLAISNAKKDYNVIFVASAGNSGPGFFTGSTPASGIDVISVGAIDKDDNLASFSSWGPSFQYLGYPDVVAPGVNIISAEAKDSSISKEKRYIGNYFDFSGDADYIPLSGTSMAAPVVSGALAILKEAYPYLTPETARIALLEGARKIPYQTEDDTLKSGAGIINVSASLNYLNSLSVDYNDTAKVFPNILPVKPYDLLHFPGDHQKFNLTVISGKSNIYDIEVPNNIQGVSIKFNNLTIGFSDSGIEFRELEIKIKEDAIPGTRNIQINLTVEGTIYDVIDITLDIRLPEHRILMESFHGLNDWFPAISFYQMGFYDAMSDISDLNISIDYGMEYWTPDYNRDTDNSILTEERLSRYDLVILQAPILPYSPLEIRNMKNYFESGGSFLFLGTRYQDMVVENINYLFSQLGLDTQINEENIMNENWLGIGARITSQSVSELNNSVIFQNVSKFLWSYGNSFTTSGNAKSVAILENKSIASIYDGSLQEKGRFLAFGDLHWIFDDYRASTYLQDHFTLLKNSLDFLLLNDDVSIEIDLGLEQTSNSQINISIYLKNQTSESPINSSDYGKLEVTIRKNAIIIQKINLSLTSSINGIYFNNTYNLPSPSYNPYSVFVNLSIGSKTYNKSAKILYFDVSKMPKINGLISNTTSITRADGESVTLTAQLDNSTYGNIEGFLTIYSSSFYNSKKSVNKSIAFSNISENNYRNKFDPLPTDPSGIAVFYIIPSNENYTNPSSPRVSFKIKNNPPEILNTTSSFNFDGNIDIYFDETENDDGSSVFAAMQGSLFNFNVDVQDSVNYEDPKSNLRVFINFFMASVTEDNFLILIFPKTIIVNELFFNALTNTYIGTFRIPNSMQYSSIAGTKTVSTAAGFDFSSSKGYLGILFITVYDSEGNSEEFIIILSISARPMDLSIIIFIVIGVIAIIGLGGMLIYFARRRKYPKITRVQPEYQYQTYDYRPSYEIDEENYITPEPTGTSIYCPFCGVFVATPKKFCSSCGESLTFNQENN
ncbi:hypothetical protein LCGC14_1368600, partial [marine sediment metagenome]